MTADSWSNAAESAVAFTTTEAAWVQKAEILAVRMIAARYLALASLAFLLYDIVATVDEEAKYVWTSSWTFGRAAFHFNRFSAPALQILHLVSLFQHNPSTQFCQIASSIYVWGTLVTVVSVIAVLIVRVWALYFQSKRVIVFLGVTAVSVSLLPILVILLGFSKSAVIEQNPAPDVILGCLFDGTSQFAWVPYVGSTLYETLLFGLTVYKVRQSEYELPIMTRLYRDGSYYFVFVLAANIFTTLGSRSELINAAATGSGFLSSIMSAMCSRMLLSTKSFESERQERALDSVTIPRLMSWPTYVQDKTISIMVVERVDIERGRSCAPVPTRYAEGLSALDLGKKRKQ